MLQADKFDRRGYVDAGDVVVLYNGVRMNSPFDNVFDFSLIDLANRERFEIIKGGNTGLYGPEAFSGVINIVPQVERDYALFAQYRMGTRRQNIL